MSYKGEKAREQKVSAKALIKAKFADIVTEGKGISAQYVRFGKTPVVIGIAGLTFDSPLIGVATGDEAVYNALLAETKSGKSVIFANGKAYSEKNGTVSECKFDKIVLEHVEDAIKESEEWGGKLNESGELICNPASPAPGPHYYTNMMLGNRIGFDRPLQSTPKSTVDRLGAGSFRAHADTQVLATRWDYLPEENGFPANRQFYLVENGKKIFWSGAAIADGLKTVRTIHSQNRSIIEYELEDGLKVKRTIFIVPQHDGMPLAAEAQMIEITNAGTHNRDLRLVYTGMFGTSETHALSEDVIFTTVVTQSEVFFNENDELRAISFNPNSKWTKGNIRFDTLVAHTDEGTVYPDEYSARYGDFVGSGSLENPEFIEPLSSCPSRKGPGFYALSVPFTVKSGRSVRVDNLVCLSSDAVNDDYVPEVTPAVEMEAASVYISDPSHLPSDLESVIDFTHRYSGYMQIDSADEDFSAYVNNNLPFQVFYQTFVSRSLDWTQKGYREIGFREIQDIYASMYYFAGMGETEFIKSMLTGWIENVYEDGYTNHNFYWTGKEPGWWSDDGLWLLQALDRYVGLTGDYDFLTQKFAMAGTKKTKKDAGIKRPLIDTVKAIIVYSCRISVGKHGIPLIDRADWNDCLRVDPDSISGADKIEKYKEQLKAKGASYGEIPFESEYSESVMNGFLLKVAIDAAEGMFAKLGDSSFAKELKSMSSKLSSDITDNCWKGDFFARVLFNRSSKPNLKYLGATGDGLAVEPGHTGTYFLNAFSWSLLAGVADEKQIGVMLDSLDRYLKSPYGFRLCSTVDYPQIAPKIDVALYYPGDRENGGVFKHANMMAASAMLKAAKSVSDDSLARRLTGTAYWIIDKIVPFKTLKSPFTVCGNPRWCTQYNNSDSGENIGPTLSGTSTWMLLSLFQCFGVEFTSDCLVCEPLLRDEETSLNVSIKSVSAGYNIHITKPEGFRRANEGVSIKVDGEKIEGTRIPVFADGKVHDINVDFN